MNHVVDYEPDEVVKPTLNPTFTVVLMRRNVHPR